MPNLNIPLLEWQLTSSILNVDVSIPWWFCYDDDNIHVSVIAIYMKYITLRTICYCFCYCSYNHGFIIHSLLCQESLLPIKNSLMMILIGTDWLNRFICQCKNENCFLDKFSDCQTKSLGEIAMFCVHANVAQTHWSECVTTPHTQTHNVIHSTLLLILFPLLLLLLLVELWLFFNSQNNYCHINWDHFSFGCLNDNASGDELAYWWQANENVRKIAKMP